MAYPANEGGFGGKFRRRPYARTPSKPYDRPPTALRGVRGGGQVAGERGGWMSKLLDPASRLIANGASKLFASMFRKRLTAPLPESGISDNDLHPGADVFQHTYTNPLSETMNGEMHIGGSSVDNQKNCSDCGIVELERLLKQKTFTMVESNRLEELLRSRTVESSIANHENSNDKKGKSVVLASDDVPGSSKVHKKFLSNGLASQTQIPMIEASSPAEVAKAYMGPSKDSSLSGSLQDQVFNEETNLKSMASAPKCLDLSVAARSVIRFSGIPGQHQYQNHAYQTAKPVGRSAMYRMSRSPYFKVNRAANTQLGEISRDDHSSPVSSQWKSRGKQALKRGITALDDEYGSFGPIRRIRQKSNLVSPLSINNSTTSMQKYLYLEGRKHGSTSSETAEDGTENNSNMLPVQSSEKEHKLFQQLDKLLPSSSKDKPGELKAMTIDESPSKLTNDMLHGSALKRMKNISSSFLSMQDVGKADTASSQQNVINAPSKSKSMDEERSLPLTRACYGMDLQVPQPNRDSKTTLPSKNVTNPAPFTQKKSASSSVSIPIHKRPAFRISAPDDSFDLDDDEDDNTNCLSTPSTSTPDSITKISVQNGSILETSAENPISSSIFSRKDEMENAKHPVLAKKENEFAFPIASDPSAQSQPHPTPTIPTPRLNVQDPQKETEQNPIPSWRSKDVKLSTDHAGVKVGEEFRSEATLTTCSSAITNSINESIMVNTEAMKKTGDVLRSPTAASETSTTSTPGLFSFGASSTSSLSNGLLNPSAATDSVPSNSIFGNNNPTNSISSISSVSSASATFSTTAPTLLFQQSDTPKSNYTEANTFKAKASSFSMPASTSQDTFSVLPTSSPSMSSSTTSTSPATSSAFSSTPCSFSGFSASTHSIGSSVFGATNGFTTNNTSFASSQISKPIVFGAIDNSSQNSTSVTFGANTNDSTQNSSTVTFGANNNNSLQNSSMTTFVASTTTSQKPDAITFGFGGTDNNPQKPSSITFGAENNKPAAFSFGSATGSIFGTQSTQIVTENAQASQCSTSQFGLFSSSPSFGLSNSSSSSFGNSPFGSTSSSPNPFTSSIFGSKSQASAPSIFTSESSSSNTLASAPVFGSSTSSSAAPFQFGSSASGSGFTFGSSASGSTSTPTTPFTPTFGFGANYPNDDQMSVEDSMIDASNQPPTPIFPTFGQPQNPTTTTTPGFLFGSPAQQQNAVPSFSFGGVPNPPVQQNASPFQLGSGVNFNPGGSFSLGSGGGDKSARKIIKVKRGLRGRK